MLRPAAPAAKWLRIQLAAVAPVIVITLATLAGFNTILKMCQFCRVSDGHLRFATGGWHTDASGGENVGLGRVS
ncbi:hypothetical protein GCM10023170_085330 [Phytohabitans houttuyneae]|uniref:Uncharacterized protein n=1 Tax=Phytohabitans houttuyneae TaxID=1076126 RepID=A0A6V8KI37_9ACTN|nr:hypothetical protein Phou_090420 [Phytohabitans houttuyneae]